MSISLNSLGGFIMPPTAFPLVLTDPNSTRLVVSLKTSYWRDRHGLHCKRDIRCLKRKSTSDDWMDEDAVMTSVDQVFERISNLYECSDGHYEVAITNEQRDWESGHIEDYDYLLIPYDSTKDQNKPHLGAPESI